jgi:hypothetical protein
MAQEPFLHSFYEPLTALLDLAPLHWIVIGNTPRIWSGADMQDVVFVLVTILFFAVGLAYVVGLERLR